MCELSLILNRSNSTKSVLSLYIRNLTTVKHNASDKRPSFHEELQDYSEVQIGSERSFGIVFTIVFVILGLLPLTVSKTPLYWALAVAALFLVLALFAPNVLAPLNRVWFKFGLLLHRIISPVIMALLFYLVITPTGLVMRLFRRDILRLRYDADADSYWIAREPADSETSSYKNQF